MSKQIEHQPKIAIYPGSFDPITFGHLDVLKRAAAMFDKVIVALAVNPQKQTLFSSQERREMIVEAIQDLSNVEVGDSSGLMVDFAREHNATILIRGLRAISDFEYEFQMALMNRQLSPDVVTVFLMPHAAYTYLNSSIVREVASFGGDIAKLVPPSVLQRLQDKFETDRK